MLLPGWYGRRYPTLDDLEAWAADLGCTVGETRLAHAAFIVGEDGEPPVILVPAVGGLLARAWSLAHELGHLSQHEGPKGELTWSRDEAQANRWAACALIPASAVRRYANASEDAFIAALWRHYEEFPLEPCPARRLAGRIARMRLNAIKEVSNDTTSWM